MAKRTGIKSSRSKTNLLTLSTSSSVFRNIADDYGVPCVHTHPFLSGSLLCKFTAQLTLYRADARFSLWCFAVIIWSEQLGKSPHQKISTAKLSHELKIGTFTCYPGISSSPQQKHGIISSTKFRKYPNSQLTGCSACRQDLSRLL